MASNDEAENKLTQEQVIEQFGNVPLRFAHYYKYMFTFAGTGENNHSVSVGVGGHSEDIYKFEVTPTRPVFLKGLIGGRDYTFIIVRDASNKIIYHEFTY